MSFLGENLKKERQMLMKVMTLRKSEEYEYILENVTQLGWLGTLTNSFPLQLVELGIVLMTNYDNSWIKMTSVEN